MRLKQKVLPYALQGLIELDETYFASSHKGKKLSGVKSKVRGTSASSRGLSNEQFCLITGVDRTDGVFSACVNRGKPKTSDITKACINRIVPQSEILTDGLESYNDLFNLTKSSYKKLVGHKSFDKVHHLNNVNSFHCKIKKMYSYYRSVSSKYLNRYGALFSIQWLLRSADTQEALLIVMKRLRNCSDHFYIRMIQNVGIV